MHDITRSPKYMERLALAFLQSIERGLLEQVFCDTCLHDALAAYNDNKDGAYIRIEQVPMDSDELPDCWAQDGGELGSIVFAPSS
jgi:hypothetical protein